MDRRAARRGRTLTSADWRDRLSDQQGRSESGGTVTTREGDHQAALDFASTEYKLDRNGRFRWQSGAVKGQFAPRAAVLAIEARSIEVQKQSLIGLGDRLSAGKISARDFQEEAAIVLRRIHVSSAILGRGGLDKMRDRDWLAVARLLKQNYYSGVDRQSDRRFGLKHLTAEFKAGAVSPAMLRSRLSMYADGGKLSYFAAEKTTVQESGKTEGKRKLASSDRACPECVELAALGWTTIADLIMPTIGCRCRNRCRCAVEYR